jgi:hypothetical protein
MNPSAFILALDLSQNESRSALPDAPVVPDRPARRTSVRTLRTVAAQALRRTADRLEPVQLSCEPAG